MTRKKAFTLMALGKVNESKEPERTLVKGVGAVHILAVNPTREEQNKILGSNRSNEPINYVGTTTVKDAMGNDVEVPQVRITFIVRTDPTIACNNGIEYTTMVSFFIAKAPWYDGKGTKYQVIDQYGRTAWVTPAEAKDKKIPTYTVKSGEHAGEERNMNITADYRASYRGESDLMEHIKEFFAMDRPDPWNNEVKAYVMSKDAAYLKDCECILDTWENIFKGNVSEIRNPIMKIPNQAYKLMFGVKTNNDGTQSQVVYMSMPHRLSNMKYDDLEAALVKDAVAGYHPNVEYKAGPLEKYTVKPTDYSQETPAETTEVVEDLPPDTSPFPTDPME